MSYPAFVWKNPSTIGWNITDAAGVPVVGAVVTATLYLARDRDFPDQIPGSAVPTMQNLSLADQGGGFYKVDLQASQIPAIGDNYVLVIDATVSGSAIGHWEESTAVVVRPPMAPDLCELRQVKDHLEISDDDTSLDKKLRRWITSCSADFLKRIRRPGLFPTNDYVETIVSFRDKWIRRVYLQNYPVNLITQVTVDDVVLVEFDPANFATPGWIFDDTASFEDRQFIELHGVQRPRMECKVTVSYNGGYSDVPTDVSEAVAEWVAYKKGLAELQATDQTEQWMQLGQYQQNSMIASASLKAGEVDVPESVAAVIQTYQMPVAP